MMEGALLAFALAPVTRRASTATARQEPNLNVGEAFTPLPIVNCEAGFLQLASERREIPDKMWGRAVFVLEIAQPGVQLVMFYCTSTRTESGMWN